MVLHMRLDNVEQACQYYHKQLEPLGGIFIFLLYSYSPGEDLSDANVEYLNVSRVRLYESVKSFDPRGSLGGPPKLGWLLSRLENRISDSFGSSIEHMQAHRLYAGHLAVPRCPVM